MQIDHVSIAEQAIIRSLAISFGCCSTHMLQCSLESVMAGYIFVSVPFSASMSSIC